MNYIVYDLECTAHMDVKPAPMQEIIEIGAVKINDHLEIVDTFTTFVKPTIDPILSGYIKRFTKIKQDDVDSAPTLPEALYNFLEWVGEEEHLFVSWTKDDTIYFRKNCKHYKMELDWLDNKSLIMQQKLCSSLQLPKGQCIGLKKAIEVLEIEKDLPMHRAINDAHYTTRIFLKTFKCYFSKKQFQVA